MQGLERGNLRAVNEEMRDGGGRMGSGSGGGGRPYPDFVLITTGSEDGVWEV